MNMKNNSQFEDAMIFKNEFNGRSAYSLGVSGKKYVGGQETGEYVNGYLNVQFSRCNEPEHRQKIDITRSFLTAYEGNDGKAKVKLVVLEWQPHTEDVPY